MFTGQISSGQSRDQVMLEPVKASLAVSSSRPRSVVGFCMGAPPLERDSSSWATNLARSMAISISLMRSRDRCMEPSLFSISVRRRYSSPTTDVMTLLKS